MREYTTPYVADYGNCKEKIQGGCGFGLEIFAWGKAGTQYYTYRDYITPCETSRDCSNRKCGKKRKCASSKPKDKC